MLIGICDDMETERQKIYDLCEQYFLENKIEHTYIMFSSGEEVLAYCERTETQQLDLLLLDIEMGGMSGIQLKDSVMKQNKIWRIAFVSSHLDSIYDSYSTKTIGFVPKPPAFENVAKIISNTLDELQEDILITLKGTKGDIIEIRLEDILCFKADGSYTEIYTYKSLLEEQKYILSTKKLGEIEAEFKHTSMVRVHKTYMVNIENVIEINNVVILRDFTESIPVGRNYKENAKLKFYEYGKNRIRKRL